MPVIDAFAIPETEQGGNLGVLLIGTLAPYRRDEERQRTHHKSELWPGLGRLRDRLSQCRVEQAVMPERTTSLARAITVGLFRSSMAIWRLSSAPEVALRSLRFTPRATDLLKWATLDVLRATLAGEAARALVKRVSMSGATVIGVTTNSGTWTPVDLALQKSGAVTVDYLHGANIDWNMASESESSARVVWVIPDAAIPGARKLIAGMPVRARLLPRTVPAHRMLLLTNYVHRDSDADSLPGATRFPAQLFQAEMLELVSLLRAAGHRHLTFRWRPHPADNEKAIRTDHARLVNVALSRDRPLEEDVAWADVVISSNSTTVIETLFAGVPIFVHLLPEQWDIPALSFLAPERLFFHAEDGAQRIGMWLTRYGATPADGLEPERLARLALFGPSGEPTPMTAHFGAKRSPAEREREPLLRKVP